MTCIYSKVVVELTFNALDLKREARPWFKYSTSPLLWAVAVSCCGKKTYVICNSKLLKVCSLNGNACGGFVPRFLI